MTTELKPEYGEIIEPFHMSRRQAHNLAINIGMWMVMGMFLTLILMGLRIEAVGSNTYDDPGEQQRLLFLFKTATIVVTALQVPLTGLVLASVLRLPRKPRATVYIGGLLIDKRFVPWAKIKHVNVGLSPDGTVRTLSLYDTMASTWPVPPVSDRDRLFARITDNLPEKKFKTKQSRFTFEPANPWPVTVALCAGQTVFALAVLVWSVWK